MPLLSTRHIRTSHSTVAQSSVPQLSTTTQRHVACDVAVAPCRYARAYFVTAADTPPTPAPPPAPPPPCLSAVLRLLPPPSPLPPLTSRDLTPLRPAPPRLLARRLVAAYPFSVPDRVVNVSSQYRCRLSQYRGESIPDLSTGHRVASA
eukprot:509611-Rhodomonas_salina.2